MSVSITGSGVSVTNAVASLSGLPSQSNNTILSNVSGGSAAPSANTVTATLDSAISSTDGKMLARGASSWAATDIPKGIGGRLTLTSGVPVLTSTVTGATAIYYTPYNGDTIPVYDGTAFVPVVFTEAQCTNTTTDATTNPAAVTTNACYDLFVWLNSGTPTLSRGPAWSKTGTMTYTIANPAVCTVTSHGLYDGCAVTFTTTGAFATGGTNDIVAGTTYYVTVVDANSFKISSSLANQVAGTYLNTTGGTGNSPTHTMTNRQVARGTGAGTSQIGLTNGIYTNTVAITNGPAANRGTYVGTVCSNSSSTIDFQIGALAAGHTPALLMVWNNYNRVTFTAYSADTADSWNYSAQAYQYSSGKLSTARHWFVRGLNEDTVSVKYFWAATNSTSTARIARVAIFCNPAPAFTFATGITQASDQKMITNAGYMASVATFDSQVPIGLSYVAPAEWATGTDTQTWAGDAAGPTIFQSAAIYSTHRL
jgi:hypothetical protein